jgi:hypothetical protein
MKPFSVVFYIVRPDMIESACFWGVSGGGLDFIHHDKACISTSIFEAAPFKM